MRRGPSLRAAVLAAALGITAGAPAGADQGAPTRDFALRAGEEVFVDGPGRFEEPVVVSPGPALDPAFCDARLQGCFDYHLTLLEPADRLRVGLDTRRSGFQVYLFNPAGEEVATEGPSFSSELAVERPAVGTWKLRVVHVAEGDTAFRIRARLERAQTKPRRRRTSVLLPNLRMQPPFSLTLETPGSASGRMDVSQLRGTAPTRGCLPSEIVTYAARRCLRFSTGPENIGAGRLQLVFEPEQPDAGWQRLEGQAFQLVDRRDGSVERRTAGDYIYHAEHTHFHHAGFAGFELLRVTDRKRGGLVPAGTGPKQGFCMADVRIVNWFEFDNALDSTEQTNCMGVGDDPTTEMRTGLGAGWADIYTYYLEGMFVDMGESPDGLYVIRVRANDRDTIHETTSRDNYSYALVEIRGDDVEVFERGYGKDPWDPRRRLADDIVQPAVE